MGFRFLVFHYVQAQAERRFAQAQAEFRLKPQAQAEVRKPQNLKTSNLSTLNS